MSSCLCPVDSSWHSLANVALYRLRVLPVAYLAGVGVIDNDARQILDGYDVADSLSGLRPESLLELATEFSIAVTVLRWRFQFASISSDTGSGTFTHLEMLACVSASTLFRIPANA